jgi:hypothetical protein
MYDDVYGRLHEMGIAEKLSEAVWRDRDNNIVTEADAYGQKTAYSLIPTQAHKLIMVDEVGENISQKGDGNAGGQKFMVAADMRAQVRNSFKDNHFTVLGFTAARGGECDVRQHRRGIKTESDRRHRLQSFVCGCKGCEQ